MRLSEADVALIHDLLKDYQYHIEHAHDLCWIGLPIPMSMSTKDTLERPYREARERIANFGRMATKVFSMDLPAGFALLRTIDDQCLAWNGNERLGLHGPVSEFQARLWCWEHEYVNEEIKINIIEEEDEEMEEDEETLEGFRASLGGVGNVTESGAVLDESMIARTFNKELWGTW